MPLWLHSSNWAQLQHKQPDTCVEIRLDHLGDIATSNVTGRHRDPKRRVRTGYTECCHKNTRPIYAARFYAVHVVLFIIQCGTARFLCAMRTFDVWASSTPLGCPCAKFCFFRTLLCWASPQRKIAYSVKHSLTQPASMMAWE